MRPSGRLALAFVVGCLGSCVLSPVAGAAETVLTWGHGGNGELGNGTLANGGIVPVGACELGTSGTCPGGPFLGSPVAIANNGAHDMALLANGTVAGWGYNGFGEVGDGLTATTKIPTLACAVGATPPCSAGQGNLLQGVSAISAGSYSSVALLGNGTVVAWGHNNFGQLGDGSMTDSPVPVRVCAVGVSSCPGGPYLSGVAAIQAGDDHVLALLENETVVAWGIGGSGELGNDNSVSSDVPVQVCAIATSSCTGGPYLEHVVGIAAGEQHSLALLKEGTVASWGLDNVGQLGNGNLNPTNTPEYVCALGATAPCSVANGNALNGVAAVSAGLLHSVALLSNETVVTWGYDRNGQLGDGVTINGAVTVPVGVCAVAAVAPCSAGNGNLLTGVTAIAGGGEFTTALMSNQTLTSWGVDNAGTLGDGFTNTSTNVPVRVCAVGATAPCSTGNGNLLTGVTVVAAGQEGAMAIAPTPTSAPHWYKKSVELPAGGPHVSVATSGNLTLQALSKEAICKVTDTEEIWNPLGGGAGQDSVTAFKLQCKSKNLCPLHTSTEVLAKGLPWPSHLLAGAPVRDEIEQIKLEVRCNGGYLDEFTGALTPEVGAGALVFGAGSGALHDGFGNPATVSGSDKLKAPPGKITAQ